MPRPPGPVPLGKNVPLGLEGEVARGRLEPSKRRVWDRGQPGEPGSTSGDVGVLGY